jgi:hypothetical protein
MDPRERERVAVNETTFRDVNEGIEEGRHEREGLVAFVCECGELGCTRLVELTLAEYETVRADPRAFVCAPGHLTDFDQLASQADRYWMVRKPAGPLAELAERTDPRREAS